MERMRRVYRGTASELFGEDALPIDKMSRHVGFYRLAKESVPLLRVEEKEILDAYSAGVNAYLDNISFIGGKTCSANLLPPELVVLGVKQLDPWEPADTLALARLMGLQLSWNWSLDLTREAVRQHGLGEFVEDLLPFTAANLLDLVTIMDEDDLKRQGHWANETL